MSNNWTFSWICENVTSPSNSAPEEALYGYALPALCFLGALANIVNIIVLADRQLVAPTYTYLFYLAIADLITLLLYFLDLIARMHFASHLLSHIFATYIYLPIGSISTCSSLLLTVAVTIDRYIFIQNPTAIASHAIPVSIQLASPRKRARKLGVVVCAVAALINSPRMAAWYVDFETGCRRWREWAADPSGWFSVYSYLRLLFLNIGSIIVLATFNVLLILLVQRSTSRRESRQSFSCKNGRVVFQAQKRKSITRRVFNKTNMSLTVTLIAATLLALAGEIPSTLLSRISASVIWKSDPNILDKEPMRYFVLAAYILIILEYSGNFIIYCLLNKRFRLVLCSKISPNGGLAKPVARESIFSGEKKKRKLLPKRSISLDGLDGGDNGNVNNGDLARHCSDRQQSTPSGDVTDNLVTGIAGEDTGGNRKFRENLSDFWRSTEPPGLIKPPTLPTSSLLAVLRNSQSYPTIVRASAFGKFEDDKIPARWTGYYL